MSQKTKMEVPIRKEKKYGNGERKILTLNGERHL
jgi:hypothetical protein